MSSDRRLTAVGACVFLLGAGCATTTPCVTEPAPPSMVPVEELVPRVADAAGDFILDHPLFAEVYDVVFEDDASIPPALDLVLVELDRDGPTHTFRLHTEGDVSEQVGEMDRHVNYGLYIDSDGNGVSEYILTTTRDPNRAVIVTPEFEAVSEDLEVVFEGNVVTMQAPADVIGERFHWIAFSGYSPDAEAFHPTAREDVIVVPDVDVVSSVPSMGGLLTFYSGPGTCQVVGKLSGATCPSSASDTVPGTSQKGKFYYRKRCGARTYEFWCLGCCFGSRVYGATTGWVGRCPYICGFNNIGVWDQNNDGKLDKVYHTVSDADCSDQPNPKKHDDRFDGDNKIDSMAHTYLWTNDRLDSCNKERDENTQALLATRCCPGRKPYLKLPTVPGSIDGTPPNYNCPVSVP